MSISQSEFRGFVAYLKSEDRPPSGTTSKYLHNSAEFAAWLENRKLTRKTAAGRRDFLGQKLYVPATINSVLSAVNCLLKFLGQENCKIRFLRIQRKAFQDQNWELIRTEYQRLLDTAAGQGQECLGLLAETICAKATLYC